MATWGLPNQESNLVALGRQLQDRSPLDSEAPNYVKLPQDQVHLVPSQGEGQSWQRSLGFLCGGQNVAVRLPARLRHFVFICPVSSSVNQYFSNLCQGTLPLAIHQSEQGFSLIR